MTLTEVIVEKIRELPEEKAREVIDFIDFLKTRRAATSSSEEDEPQRRQREQVREMANPSAFAPAACRAWSRILTAMAHPNRRGGVHAA
jgi:uncharacterized protein with von Willebrand factor type A (vWA) domain